MIGCDSPRYAYSQMVLEVDCSIAELERIAGLRRYMRERLLEIVDELVELKERVNCGGAFFRQDTVDLSIRIQKLEELWMRRRRMREALLEVGYHLDHIKNKMKWELLK